MKAFCLACVFLVFVCALRASPEADIAQALDGPLKGYRYNKRLATPALEDHLLVFTEIGGRNVRLVAWTEATDARDRYAAAPVSPMSFTILNPEGEELETFEQTSFSLVMKLEPKVRIYAPEEVNDYLRVVAAVESIRSPITVLGPQTIDLHCTFSNPLNEDLFFTSENPSRTAVIKPGGSYTLKRTVEVGRPAKPIEVLVDGLGVVQRVVIQSQNPLDLQVWPRMDRAITLELANPTGSPFRGEGEIYLITGDGQEPPPFRFPVAMSAKQTSTALQVPLNYDGMLPYPIQVKISQRSSTELGKEFVLTQTPPLQFFPLPVFKASDKQGMPTAYEGRTQGDAHWSMTAEIPPEGAPVESRGVMVLVYSLKAGAISIKVRPKDPVNQAIPGTPAGYGLWVYGDNSNNFVTCGIRDARGRVFQPDPVKLDWKGWRYLNFRWPSGMREPLTWDSVLELVNGGGEANGAVFANNPTLLYELRELETEVIEETEPEEPEIIDRRNEVPSAIPIYNLPQRP